METTLKSTQNGAKKNILSNSAIRYVGLVTSFIGLILLITKTTFTGTVMEIISVLLLLIGTLLFVSNLKLAFASKGNKDVLIQILTGLAFIALGVLIIIFGDEIGIWIDLAVGILIAIYGLVLLINHIVNKRKKMFVFDLIISSLLIAAGVLIALLYFYSSLTYKNVVAIFATVSGILHILYY